MSRNVKNMAASVHARLKNEARAAGRPFNELLQYYAMERFLYRLGQSPHTDRFVLKGALLLRARSGAAATRPTRDIDLLRHGPSTAERLADVSRSCCTVEVEDDGMRFDPGTVTSSEIRPEAVCDGVCIKLEGYLGSARVHLQVDVGTGDAVVPGPVWIDYPGLLHFREPRLRARKCRGREISSDGGPRIAQQSDEGLPRRVVARPAARLRRPAAGEGPARHL